MSDEPKTLQEALEQVRRNAAKISEESALERVRRYAGNVGEFAKEYGRGVANAAVNIVKGAPQAVSSREGAAAAGRGAVQGLTGRSEPVSGGERSDIEKAQAASAARRFRRPDIAAGAERTAPERAQRYQASVEAEKKRSEELKTSNPDAFKAGQAAGEYGMDIAGGASLARSGLRRVLGRGSSTPATPAAKPDAPTAANQNTPAAAAKPASSSTPTAANQNTPASNVVRPAQFNKPAGSTTPASGGAAATPKPATGTSATPKAGMTPVEKGAVAAGVAAGAAGVAGLASQKSGETASAQPAANTASTPAKAPQTFGQAFKSAREKATAGGSPSTGSFQWTNPKTGETKTYQTNVAGEKYVAPSKQTQVDRPEPPPKPTSTPSTSSTASSNTTSTSTSSLPPEKKTEPSAAQADAMSLDPKKKTNGTTTNEETKMSSMVEAFLKLHKKESHDNLFSEAKKHKKHLDPVGKEDEDIDNDGDKDKSDEYLHNRRKAIGKAIKESGDEGTAGAVKRDGKDVVSPTAPGGSGYKKEGPSDKEREALTKKVEKIQKENVEFSETELAHIAAIMEISVPASPVADDYTGSNHGVSKRDLSDETISETKKKDPSELKQRGRKAGVKVGSYKRKDTPDAEPEEHKAEPKNLVAQNPRTRNENGKNVVDLEHPSKPGVKRTVPAKHYNDFRSSYLNAEKPADKQKMHDNMVSRVFGNN